MKRLTVIFSSLMILTSCVENKFDASLDKKKQNAPLTLNSLLTKSGVVEQEDSLMMVSKQQADIDNLMMGRIIEMEGQFVLALKREDAIFLGVSEEIYETYQELVNQLNKQVVE